MLHKLWSTIESLLLCLSSKSHKIRQILQSSTIEVGGTMFRKELKIIQITEFLQEKVVFELDAERLAGS